MKDMTINPYFTKVYCGIYSILDLRNFLNWCLSNDILITDDFSFEAIKANYYTISVDSDDKPYVINNYSLFAPEKEKTVDVEEWTKVDVWSAIDYAKTYIEVANTEEYWEAIAFYISKGYKEHKKALYINKPVKYRVVFINSAGEIIQSDNDSLVVHKDYNIITL